MNSTNLIYIFLATILLPLENFASATTFDELKFKIQNYEEANPGKTYSIETIIQELPPELLSNFTLIKESRSLQEGSSTSPRAILFGLNGKTILTFNGDSQQRGFNSLEFAEINQATSAIEFKEMAFPPNGSTVGNVKFSGPNPDKCMACHGPSTHYIWNSYARWPGALGSFDDIVDMNGEEKEALKLFKDQKAAHPRYRNLQFYRDQEYPASPFRPLTPGLPGDSRGDYQIAIEFRPNFRLGTILSRNQARARVSAWKNSPNFPAQKFKLAYHLAACESDSASELKDVLNNLGFDYSKEFHFTIGSSNARDRFHPSLASFLNSVQHFVWIELIAGNPELQFYQSSYAISEAVVKLPEIKLADSPLGILQWQAIDQIALIEGNLKGATEANYYARTADIFRPDPTMHDKICSVLRGYIQ